MASNDPQAGEHVPRLSEQLEQRVTERTAELERVNRELSKKVAELERAELASWEREEQFRVVAVAQVVAAAFARRTGIEQRREEVRLVGEVPVVHLALAGAVRQVDRQEIGIVAVIRAFGQAVELPTRRSGRRNLIDFPVALDTAT